MLDTIKTVYALKNGVSLRGAYNWHAPVFLFTNENISGYLKGINSLAEKKVLTVTGSGDHAFECLLNGASSVDTFDINYLQKHVMELKAKMIKHLPYSEFMRFFFDENNFFNRDIIKPIWHTFSGGLKVFLNKYYKTHDNSMFRYHASQTPFYTTDKISYINDEQAYIHLGHIMPDKIKFKNTDLNNITNEFNEVYNTILLSNIFEYAYEEIPYTAGKVKIFYDNILCKIADKNLSDNGGQICFQYAWRASKTDYAAMIATIQRHMKYSIDSFDTHERTIDMICVPSACTILPTEKKRSDIVLTMTQKSR